MNDVIINKAESIERCVAQVRTYYASRDNTTFAENHLLQDAIAINIQRACEQSIDLANHVIRKKSLGIPKSSRGSFRILAENGFLDQDLAEKLQKMIGFRNILVHQYQSLDTAILISVIESGLDDLLRFTSEILRTSE